MSGKLKAKEELKDDPGVVQQDLAIIFKKTFLSKPQLNHISTQPNITLRCLWGLRIFFNFKNFFRCLFKKRRNYHFENFQLWKIYPFKLFKWTIHFNCWLKFQRVVTFDSKVQFSQTLFLNWSIFQEETKM